MTDGGKFVGHHDVDIDLITDDEMVLTSWFYLYIILMLMIEFDDWLAVTTS